MAGWMDGPLPSVIVGVLTVLSDDDPPQSPGHLQPMFTDGGIVKDSIKNKPQPLSTVKYFGPLQLFII